MGQLVHDHVIEDPRRLADQAGGDADGAVGGRAAAPAPLLVVDPADGGRALQAVALGQGLGPGGQVDGIRWPLAAPSAAPSPPPSAPRRRRSCWPGWTPAARRRPLRACTVLRRRALRTTSTLTARTVSRPGDLNRRARDQPPRRAVRLAPRGQPRRGLEQADRMNGAKTGRACTSPGSRPGARPGTRPGRRRAPGPGPRLRGRRPASGPARRPPRSAATRSPAATTRASKWARLSPPGGADWSSPAKRAVSSGPAGLDLLQRCSPTIRRRRIRAGRARSSGGRPSSRTSPMSCAVRRARARSEVTTTSKGGVGLAAGRPRGGSVAPLRPTAGDRPTPASAPPRSTPTGRGGAAAGRTPGRRR